MSHHDERGRTGSRKFQSAWILMYAGIVLLLLGALTGCSGVGASGGAAPGGAKGGKKGAGGDVPVAVAVAATKNVPVEVQVIGHVEAYATISVKAQVTGELMNAHFQEGDYVKKNDLIFNIDPRPLQAALNQAVANVAHDQAALGQAQI